MLVLRRLYLSAVSHTIINMLLGIFSSQATDITYYVFAVIPSQV